MQREDGLQILRKIETGDTIPRRLVRPALMRSNKWRTNANCPTLTLNHRHRHKASDHAGLVLSTGANMAKLQVPITKAKASVEVDTDAIPEAVFAEALLQGLKVLLNRGMSKITKAELGDEATVKAEAKLKGEANLADLMAGKFRKTGGKSKGVPGAVMTEARRLARNLVKAEMKREGIKISHVEASEITRAANELLETQPSIIEEATANLAAVEAKKIKINVKSIAISDKKVKAAESKKAKAKETLSAKQAGKVQTRAKGKPAQQLHA